MGKKWLVLIVTVIALFSGLYFGSPYWAVHNFRSAAEAGDADALEAAVDFPVVRENLKSRLTTAMMEKLQNDPEMANNPFAGLGVMMVPAMVNSVIDGFVTPDGVARLIRNGKMDAAETNETGKQTPPDIEYEYAGFDRFRVKMKPAGSKDEPAGLLFERRGLFSWKIIRLEIPDEVFANKEREE